MLSPFSLFRRLIRIVFLFFLLLSKQNSSQHHQSKIASTRFTDRFQSLGWEKKKEKRKISSSIIRSLRYSWNSTHSRRSSSLQSSSRTGWHVAPRNYSTLHTFLRIHRSFLTFHSLVTQAAKVIQRCSVPGSYVFLKPNCPGFASLCGVPVINNGRLRE